MGDAPLVVLPFRNRRFARKSEIVRDILLCLSQGFANCEKLLTVSRISHRYELRWFLRRLRFSSRHAFTYVWKANRQRLA
jgi:hypothetical protein